MLLGRSTPARMSLIGFIGPETEKITQGQKIFAIFCEPALYSPEARVEKGKNFSKIPLQDGGFSDIIYSMNISGTAPAEPQKDGASI